MRYKENFVATVNSSDDLSKQLKSINYEQIAKTLEKSSAGLNKAIESIVSKIDYDTIYKSIASSSLAVSEAIRSINENYSKILNTVPKIITEYSSSIEIVYKSLNSFYNSKEFIALCETLINSNNYNYSEEDTKEVINSITYKDIENINKMEIKNDHSLPRQIIIWLMITFILEPLIAIPQEQITNWYKEQIPKIVEFINSKYKKMSEISIFSTEKISVSKLNRTSYISTENMLPNLSGIIESASLPKVDKVTSFKKGDILLSNIRPYFKKMWYARFDGGCSNDVLVIRSEKGIDSKYLYYFLSQPTFFQYVTETSKGTKMPRGDKQAIMKYNIYLPSKIIQKKIVMILENIDKKIELNKKINNNLHELLKNEFNEKFTEKKKENWIEDKLGNYLSVDRGLSYKGKFLSDSGIPMINLGNVMPNGVFRIEKTKHYSGEYKDKVTAKAGDIVIANTDMTQNREIIGTPVIIPPIYDGKVIFSHHIYCLRNLKLPKMFIFHLLLTEQWNGIAGGSATGTTVLALPKETIENYNITIPDKESLNLFNNIAINIQEKREQIILENIKLEQLRDTLLPKLMNHEINLDNIEI